MEGSLLVKYALWRYIFFINVPLGLIAVLILLFRVAETLDHKTIKKIDFPGAIIAALSLACITYGLLSLPDHSFWTFFVAGSIGMGIICFLIFIRVEWKTDNPMMPLSLFRDKVFAGTNLLTFFLYAGLGGAMLFLSLNLVQAQGYSQLQSGMAFLPFTLLMIALSGFAGRLSDKYGARLFLTFGPMLSALGFFLLSLAGETEGPKTYWVSFFPGILALGIGMSFTVSPLTATVMGSVKEEFSGVASGINNSLSRIASVFANAIFGALALIIFSNTVTLDLKSRNYSPSEYKIIESRASGFGAARAPKNFIIRKQIEINKTNRQSFIHSYQLVLKGAAVLAMLAAIVALVFLKPGRLNRQHSSD
ncbi:MFS transporter [Pedobacter psychrodurus]|uniref:MFS transporter n=1 Tax=Pedobacter psychrodurus TaxID=2530456 RepID=UPI00292E459B|nr:MFS transporter [Pedobacter psychrodurus]